MVIDIPKKIIIFQNCDFEDGIRKSVILRLSNLAFEAILHIFSVYFTLELFENTNNSKFNLN